MTVMLFTGCNSESSKDNDLVESETQSEKKYTFEGKSIEELQKYSLKQLKKAPPNEYITQKGSAE